MHPTYVSLHHTDISDSSMHPTCVSLHHTDSTQIVQTAVCTQPVLDCITFAIKSTSAEAMTPVRGQLEGQRREVKTE